MRLVKLGRAGAGILHREARAVRVREELPGLRALLREMRRVLLQTRGRGIAAPQLGEPLRLFLMMPDEPRAAPITVVNPRILRASKAAQCSWESCLSIPHLVGLVARRRSVHVEYETTTGETVRRILRGDAGFVFQHELDHLDGVLFTERAEPGSVMHEHHFGSLVRRGKLQLEVMSPAHAQSMLAPLAASSRAASRSS